MKTKLSYEFTKGFIAENPVFIVMLGFCPTLAVTSSAINGMSMGLATTMVLIFSNILISMIRNIIPENIRIPAYIIVIATFVTIVDLSMSAYFPGPHKVLGLYIPLIVVNCIILGRAEAYASKNNIFYSAVDGVTMGLGFTLSLMIIGAIRELLGNGSFFGISVFGDSFQPALVMVLPPGAFFTLAFLLIIVNKFRKES